MNTDEKAYLDMLENILNKGFVQKDRTGVGTLAQHGCALRFNLRNKTIPLITTRKTFFRGAVEELLWLLRGETDISYLKDKNINIWNGNTTKEFIEKRGLKDLVPENDVGTLYGFQIRNWGGDYKIWKEKGVRTGVDQLARLLRSLKEDPDSRRHLISNHNVTQLDTGVLEPCHTLYAFTVDRSSKELHSTLFMRSTDACCGLVLNILHVSLLTHLLSKFLGYNAGDFIYFGNNVHIYKNHIEDVKEQIKREPYPFPKLKIKKQISSLEDIESLCFEDFEIEDYNFHPPIKYIMAI